MNTIEKCRNVMLSVAIGDAFGAGYENLPRNEVSRRFNFTKYDKYPCSDMGSQAGHYTDDTQMSIAVAELLYSQSVFNARNLISNFLDAYKRDKRPGYSGITQMALEESSSLDDFLNREEVNSSRNGAAMRAVPIGVIQDINKVIDYGAINAEATHQEPSAVVSSIVVALASHYFFHSLGEPKSVFEFCLDHIKPFDENSRNYLRNVSDMKAFDPELLFGKEHTTFGVPMNGIKTAGAALFVVSRYSEDPKEVLKQAVLLGGDTDTTASISLGIIAGRKKIETLPSFLFDKLESGPYGKDFIAGTGTKLATILPMSVETIRRFNYSGKRQNMIVQSFDGLKEPIDPVYLSQIIKQLFSKVDYKKCDFILAIDASGYIVGVAASMVVGIPLVTSKKAELDIKSRIMFLEPGSPHPEIFLYGLPPNSKVIIVDDEILTGNTVMNLGTALKANGHEVLGIVVPVESTKYKARERLEEAGFNLISHTKHELE